MTAFRIAGPAVISFSGGRTSAYMLRRILDAHDGLLPPDVHVLFENTGREREETLFFVRECATRWGVLVHWLERPRGGGVREVDFASAARENNPRPFADLLADRDELRASRGEPPDLPGFGARWCSVELKVMPMRAWMLAAGYGAWSNVIGIRYDEPRRWSKYLGRREREWDYAMPLYEAHVTKRHHVRPFWEAQSFDLGLEDYEGNCDVCFLKSIAATRRLLKERPKLAAWWITQEQRTGVTFRRDRPSLAALQRVGEAQLGMLQALELETTGGEPVACVCDLEAA